MIMKKRKIRKEYKKMLKRVEERLGDQTLRVNNYTCQTCGHITKTMDVDPGVTPFIHRCEMCGNEAYSNFYNDRIPHKPATQEWFRPSLEVCYMMDEGELHHILNGGLIPRKIVDNFK